MKLHRPEDDSPVALGEPAANRDPVVAIRGRTVDPVGRNDALDWLAARIVPGASVVIAGEPGIGSSAVADAAGARLRWTSRVLTVRGNPLGRSLALAALAPVLRRQLVGEPGGQLVAQVLDELLDSAAPTTLVAHDIHHFDDASCIVLQQFVDLGGSVVATVPLTAVGDEPARGLWSRVGGHRLDLGPLDKPSTTAMAAGILGGPVSAGSAELLYNQSLGNPRILRELVLAAIDEDVVERVGDHYRLSRLPTLPDRLNDQIVADLTPLPDNLRHLLELVAVGGELNRQVVAAYFGSDTVDRLLELRLLTVSDDDVRLAHPVHGAVIGGRLDRRTQHHLGAELIELTRPDAAARLEAGDDQRPEPSDPAARLQLARSAAPDYLSGRIRQTLNLTGPLIDRVDEAAIIASAMAVSCLVRTGQARQALALADWAMDAREQIDGPLFPHRASFFSNQILARLSMGDFTTADADARAAYERAVHSADDEELGWLALAAARAAYQRGHPTRALAAASDAATRFRHLGLAPVEAWAQGIGAAAAAMSGDHSAMERSRQRLDVSDTGPGSIDSPDVFIGRVWASWAAGDVRRLDDWLIHAIDWATEQDLVGAELELRHLAARLGRSIADPERIAVLATKTDSPLASVIASAVDAMVGDDCVGLVNAAEAFETLGADLFAAECLARASGIHARSGNRRDQMHCRTRCVRILEGLGPIEISTVDCGPDVGLSPRELEVCQLVLRLGASKDVATALGLSVRTVNNHLQRAYAKLGISSRSELRDAFAVQAGV